eukprot:gb/GFBE01082760.1/.p1 GENE.gb/GFBE01082760.1/~~gb/GFBE01082760.1/.p1  ORF type:complete len:208 (+),score=64.88 gb/GFBE01082760.1/:1-624(+)
MSVVRLTGALALGAAAFSAFVPSFSATTPEEESAALAADDACLTDGAEDCGLELRQLRGTEEASQLEPEAVDPWMRIGYEDTQCFPSGGPDEHEVKDLKECQALADKAKADFIQYNAETKHCASTMRCNVKGMVTGATGWKSYGKDWCVTCGRSMWVSKGKSKECCKASCWEGYYWTPYGATVDCGGGNHSQLLTNRTAEAEATGSD